MTSYCLQFSPLQYICILSLHLSCTIWILLPASSLNIELCPKSEFLLVSKSSCIPDCSEPFQTYYGSSLPRIQVCKNPFQLQQWFSDWFLHFSELLFVIQGTPVFRGVPCCFPLPLPIQMMYPITSVLSVVCLTYLHFEFYGNIEHSGVF